MNILFVTDNYPPEVNAPAARTFEHCKRWSEVGYDVTVITCAPNFPQGKTYEGYKNRLYQRSDSDGIRVVRVWSYMTANSGFARRVLDYVSFAIMAFFAGLFHRADVIVITSPQFFTTFTGLFLSVIKRRPWVFELRDLWPESIVTVGAMKKSAVIRMLEKVERFMYRRCDLIVAVTDAFKDRLIGYGINPDHIVVVPNGVDASHFYPTQKDAALVRELHLERKFVLGYVGTHGMAHSLDFIMETLGALKDQDIHLLCVGDGARKALIMERAEALSLSNVTFLPPVAKEEVPRYLSVVDAVLVPLKRSDTFRTVIPSKIFEAAAMRKPILLGVDGQARKIVEKYKAGLFFEPENQQALLDAISKLKSHPNLCEDLGQGGATLAKAFDRNVLARKMGKDLENIVNIECD